ncbi:MAG: PepSY-associated TM helix domain-containing protein, partial [Pseudomonadota bacterium]
FEFEYSPGVIFLTMGIEQEAVAEMTEHIRPGLQTEEAAGVTAVLVPLTEPLRKAREQWNGASPSYIQVQHPGDQAAVITMGKRSDDLTRRAATLRFRGATGELLEPAPPWSGDVVFNSVVLALHEGRFASYPLRWLYFLSGLLGAAMIATGLLLWAKKRHARLRGATPGRGLIFIERTNLAIIVGLPLAVLAYFWANRLLPVAMAQREAWEVHCMFLVWALSFAHAGFRELRRAWREQVAVLALLCLLLPVLSTLTTDVGLVSSLREGDWLRAGFELFSVGFGLALCLSWPRLKAPEPRPGNTATDTASPMSTTVPGSAEV